MLELVISFPIVSCSFYMFSIILKHYFYYWLFAGFFFVMLLYQYTEPQFEAIYFFSVHHSLFGNFFFRWITELGDFVPYLVLMVIFAFLKNREQVLKIAFVAVLTSILAYTLKNIFLHDRPGTILENYQLLNSINWVPEYKILKGHFSFPSGHSMSGFALWTTMACYFVQHKGGQIVCFFIAVLICISRMYLGAHFPQDVLVGAVIGVTIATFVEYFVETNRFFTDSDRG